MKVGVIVPARNALPTIETLLTSINAQTHPCAAYICDDASDDGMTKFLRDRPSWYRRHVVNDRQRGWPASLNTAANFALVDGCDALMVAAADDFLRLDCIEKLVHALARHDWVIPHLQQIGGDNVVQASSPNATLGDFAIWPPLVDKAMVSSQLWLVVGGYAEDLRLPGSWGAVEDWEWWIRVFKAGFTDYGVVPEPLYYYRMHPGQLGRHRAGLHDQYMALLRARHPDLWANLDLDQAAAIEAIRQTMAAQAAAGWET